MHYVPNTATWICGHAPSSAECEAARHEQREEVDLPNKPYPSLEWCKHDGEEALRAQQIYSYRCTTKSPTHDTYGPPPPPPATPDENFGAMQRFSVDNQNSAAMPPVSHAAEKWPGYWDGGPDYTFKPSTYPRDKRSLSAENGKLVEMMGWMTNPLDRHYIPPGSLPENNRSPNPALAQANKYVYDPEMPKSGAPAYPDTRKAPTDLPGILRLIEASRTLNSVPWGAVQNIWPRNQANQILPQTLGFVLSGSLRAPKFSG